MSRDVERNDEAALRVTHVVFDAVPEDSAEAKLEVGRRRQLPEGVHMSQITWPGGLGKERLVAAPSHLERGLPRTETLRGEEPVQRCAGLSQSPCANERHVR